MLFEKSPEVFIPKNEGTLKLYSNMIDDSNDETNFPRELLLTDSYL